MELHDLIYSFVFQRVVGNPTLYRQLESASAAIKRDIVFASSLYVS